MSRHPSARRAFDRFEPCRKCASATTFVVAILGCGAATEGRWQPENDRGLEPQGQTANAEGTANTAGPTEIARVGGCDPRPLWVSHPWDDPDDPETPPAWLSPSEDSTQIFWSQIETTAHGQLLALATGLSTPVPTSADVPWRLLLGRHSVSARLALRTLSQLFTTYDSLDGIAETGGIATTPNGRLLAQATCTEGTGDLLIWNTDEPGSAPERHRGRADSACLTSFTLEDDLAVLGDRLGIWRSSLDTEELSSRWSTAGPVGRIDLSRDRQRISVAYVNADLIDLEAGSFPAICDVLDADLTQLIARFPVSGSLSNVRRSPPGSLSIPSALSPDGKRLAFFDAERNLRLRSGSAFEEDHELEVAPPRPPSRTQEDALTDLPVIADFSPDGRFLSSVRGRSLTTFACPE